MKDARGLYEAYFQRKSTHYIAVLDLDLIRNLEIEKYILISNLIKDALHNKKHWTEKEWQKLMGRSFYENSQSVFRVGNTV